MLMVLAEGEQTPEVEAAPTEPSDVPPLALTLHSAAALARHVHCRPADPSSGGRS